MIDRANDAMTTVFAILYIVIGGTLLLSGFIVWLSRVLKKDQWRLEP